MINTILNSCTQLFTGAEGVACKLVAPLFITNETTFIVHSIFIGLFAIGAVKLGRGALTAFMAVCWVLGNLFVITQANLFGLNVVTSDGFAIGASLSLTLLQEYYGKQAAKNGILIGFYMAFFFVIMSQVHLAYIPMLSDTTHQHFIPLLERMVRIVGTSFLVAFISMNLNLFLFGFFNKLFGKAYFSLNALLSISLSQLVDTVLFAVLALSGNVDSLLHIILFSCIVKVISASISIPVVSLARTYIKAHRTL